MHTPVALYVPNLLGYARIVLAFVGLHLSTTRPLTSIAVWLLSASLDLFDGIAARRLNQTSSLGVFLDVCADNVLRTCVWMAAVMVGVVPPVVACAVTSIEWFTALCTQLHATTNSSHWKEERENDPWLIRNCFAHNFRSPLGVWIIYGLFFAGALAYGSVQGELHERIPFYNVFLYLAYAGRCLALCVELWLCGGYISLITSNDEKARGDASGKQE